MTSAAADWPAVDALPADSEDVRRRQVLEAAARLLAQDGPHGLTLRRVATEAGGSTQIVYTLFGGKPGLADALYSEGFRRLRAMITARLATAPPPPDPERIAVAGRIYLDFARAEPAFFSVMFGRAIPGFTPSRETRTQGRLCTFGELVAIVEQCLAAGTLVGDSAEDLARMCWATVHGLASLDTAGLLQTTGDHEAFLDRALRVPIDAHRPGPS